MEVQLKGLILMILVITIGGSNGCINSRKSNKARLSTKENFLVFISDRDTAILEKGSYRISEEVDSIKKHRKDFVIYLIDSNSVKKILEFKRPKIIIMSKGTELIGKAINYYSSNRPPNADFFFLLEKGSETKIGLTNNVELYCYRID